MLVRVSLKVEDVGEAGELADIGRLRRLGAVIGELAEEIERAHPGVAILEHALAIRCEPAKGQPAGPVIIR